MLPICPTKGRPRASADSVRRAFFELAFAGFGRDVVRLADDNLGSRFAIPQKRRNAKPAQFANLLRKGIYRDYMMPEDELKSAIV
jgi:hypothetical protein